MNESSDKPRTPGEAARRRFAEALENLETAPENQRLKALIHLTKTLRPSQPDQLTEAQRNLDALTLLVEAEENFRDCLREALLWLFASKHPVRLFSDSGILANESFMAGTWRRITHRLLPVEKDLSQLNDVVNLLFSKETDHQWLDAIPDEKWVALLDALHFEQAGHKDDWLDMQWKTLDALQVISYRIAGIGLEPELVRNHPAIERYESPFLSQSAELRQFIQERIDASAEKREPEGDDKHLLVLLDQCDEVTQKVRKQAEKNGASISLNILLIRLEQNVQRMRVLLRLLEPRPAHERNIERVRLFKILVHAENRRFSLREHGSQTLELLSRRITSNAGRTGEKYITTTPDEYFSLFRSAAGAGLLVALMAAIKLWMSAEPHAPLVEALVYSSNYVIGFVLMYVFHFTLATKQPAMTANRIAHSMDADGAGKQRALEGLSELIVRTIRSQFVAVMGNISIAIPVAIAVTTIITSQTGVPQISAYKAEVLLNHANPGELKTWLWAGLTGVWLFVSGLVSGYYDNKAVYSRIPQRIRQLRWLRKMIGVRFTKKLANYVEDHLGGLAGSIVFGLLLGSTAAIGKILGLDIDTLHVTFVTANTVFAWMALDLQLGAQAALIILGITVIGLMNLLVSFGIALVVALRSRGVRFADTAPLIRLLALRLVSRPQDYVWPPRVAMEPPEGGSDKSASKAKASSDTTPTPAKKNAPEQSKQTTDL